MWTSWFKMFCFWLLNSGFKGGWVDGTRTPGPDREDTIPPRARLWRFPSTLRSPPLWVSPPLWPHWDSYYKTTHTLFERVRISISGSYGVSRRICMQFQEENKNDTVLMSHACQRNSAFCWPSLPSILFVFHLYVHFSFCLSIFYSGTVQSVIWSISHPNISLSPTLSCSVGERAGRH